MTGVQTCALPISEVELLLERHGLQSVLFEEWMNGKKPGFDSWNVVWAIENAGGLND